MNEKRDVKSSTYSLSFALWPLGSFVEETPKMRGALVRKTHFHQAHFPFCLLFSLRAVCV